MTRRRGIVCAATVLVIALCATACTAGSSAGSGADTTSAPSPTTPTTAPRASSAPPTPVSTGPTRSARATACPFVEQGYVRPTIGERLGRITVQRSGGKVVGCRFYALQDGALHESEHLPGPHQPAAEITTTRFGSAEDAHNAFVLLADRGTGPGQADLGNGVVGVCYMTDFYAPDHGQDAACAVNKGDLEVVVRTVDTAGTFNTIAVMKKVLGAVQA